MIEQGGKPKIALSYDEAMQLLSHCPQWHGIAYGPKIPFGNGFAKIEVNTIFKKTYDDALEAMWFNVRYACDEQGMEFKEEQWEIYYLHLMNGC